jgi:hypothetical protein
MLWPKEVTRQQAFCLEKIGVVLNNECYGSLVDHSQSANQIKYTRDKMVMEDVDRSILNHGSNDEMEMKTCRLDD